MKTYEIAKDSSDFCADISVSDESGKVVWVGRSGAPKLQFVAFSLSNPDGCNVVTAELEPPAKPVGYQRYVLKQDDKVECSLKQTGFWSGKMFMEFPNGDSCTFRMPQCNGNIEGQSKTGWSFHVVTGIQRWRIQIHDDAPDLLLCMFALLYRESHSISSTY